MVCLCVSVVYVCCVSVAMWLEQIVCCLCGGLMDDDKKIPIVAVGTAAYSVPGRTVEDGATLIMTLLQSAADGNEVLSSSLSAGQWNEWLHQRFIRTELVVGKKTWQEFKKIYKDEIELDEQQQWVRLRGSQMNVPPQS